MGDEYIDKLIELLRENNKQQESSRKESTLLMKEQTGAIVKQNSLLEEVKISLQMKPCMITDREEKINQGWKDTSLSLYRWVISGLFIIIIGILAGVGLFDKTILKLMK